MRWIEPCAGAAACALYAVGGPSLVPPVSYMGGKRRLAPLIVDALIGHERPDDIVLNDLGTWGWVWPVLLGPDGERTAEVLRDWQRMLDWPAPDAPWSTGHARELWTWLASMPPSWDDPERNNNPGWDAAQWLWLQARSASGVPVWWSGKRFEAADHGTGRTTAAGQTGDPGWRMGEELKKARRGDRTLSQTGGGLWQMGNERGGVPDASAKGVNKAGAGGIMKPSTVAERIDRIRASGWASSRMGPDGEPTIYQGTGHAGWFNPAKMGIRIDGIREHCGTRVTCLHGDASDVPVGIGDVVLFDPPYHGATGYEAQLARESVLELATRWANAGAVVAICEAEPLEALGWYQLDLTPWGTGKGEWLTMSRAPVRKPAVQVSMFEEAACPS